MESNIKRIRLEQEETINSVRARVVTKADNWKIRTCDYESDRQLQLILMNDDTNSVYITMKRQIQSKLHGYKSQDLKKDLFSPEDFVTLETALNLLKTSGLTCFYCKHRVNILYEQVRDPYQWTLERIDNSAGHNTGNVEIACLTCNLRRRTMYHERFAFTKQLVVTKLI